MRLLLGLTAIALAVVGLVNAGVITDAGHAAWLLVALVAVFAFGFRRLLQLVLVGAGLFLLVRIAGAEVLGPFGQLVVLLVAFWFLFGGLRKRSA